MIGQGEYCRLELRTLYNLANEHLSFHKDNLKPLSLDGREGRQLQYELIKSILVQFFSTKLIRKKYSDISPDTFQKWQATSIGKEGRFVSDIMNEFASVLDAEGIRQGEEAGEKYAQDSRNRPNWLMPLPLPLDRRFILEIHSRYRKLLGEMEVLSVDQMVADFNSFLDSNRWDRIREQQGFDALFVDELHLFTAIERQILQKLIKRTLDENDQPRRPPIFMAYDLKQSPRDVFTQYIETDNNLFSARTGLQGSELIKLSKIFRYTPEIAEFLADLDASFPAIDIPGDWNAYSGEAQLESGNIPELIVFKDEISLFQKVFDEAIRLAQRLKSGGRRVAVLCPSDEMFDKYVEAANGQFPGRVVCITDREPAPKDLRTAGKKIVFSMPEYVAGLQFEHVFLIHVDAEAAPANAGIGTRRQFISNVYLGASRTEKTLKIYSCISRGGPSDILTLALERRTIIEVAS